MFELLKYQTLVRLNEKVKYLWKTKETMMFLASCILPIVAAAILVPFKPFLGITLSLILTPVLMTILVLKMLSMVIKQANSLQPTMKISSVESSPALKTSEVVEEEETEVVVDGDPGNINPDPYVNDMTDWNKGK